MEKILSISLKLNFTPNTSGCYELTNENNLYDAKAYENYGK